MSRREDVLKALQKDSPTSTSVHVPAPLTNGKDGKGKSRRQRALDALTTKKVLDGFVFDLAKAMAKSNGDTEPTTEGKYVGRRVLNADALQAWWTAQRRPDEPELIDANPHLTVAYSRVDFAWVDDPCVITVDPSCFDCFKVLGKDNAVVLKLHVPILESRWRDTLAAGAAWDYDGYQPHVTLFYLGADAYGDEWRDGFGSRDWRDAKPPAMPAFPLVLGGELTGPRGQNIFGASAPAWYVPPKS
jgi:hypothetical protein